MERSELVEIRDDLKEIQTKMEELCHQAIDVVRDLQRDEETHLIGERAYCYWLPHIMMEITEENMWVGNPMCGLFDTILEVEEELEEMENDYDEQDDDE